MAKIKNLQTGEELVINNSVVRNGELWVFNKTPRLGERWFAKRPMLSQDGTVEGTAPNLALRMSIAEPWVLDTSKPERKPRTPKVRQPEPEQPEPEQPTPQPEPEQPQPTPQPVQPASTFNVDGLQGGLAQVFAPVFQQVATQIEENIRAKVATEMADLKRVAEEKARTLKIELPDGTKTKVDGITLAWFDDMVRDLAAGWK